MALLLNNRTEVVSGPTITIAATDDAADTTILGGDAATVAGGDVIITAGFGGAAGGGDVLITSGGATGGVGGNVIIDTGTAPGKVPLPGDIRFQLGGNDIALWSGVFTQPVAELRAADELDLTLQGGNDGSISGGAVNVVGGTATTSGVDGGLVTILGGAGLDAGDGGSVLIAGGGVANTSAGDGGSVTINGASTNGDGGDILIEPGISNGAGEDGNVRTGFDGTEVEYFDGFEDGSAMGASTTAFTYPVATNSASVFEIYAIARDTSGVGAVLRLFGGFTDLSGTSTIIGTTTKDRVDDGGVSADWDVDVAIVGNDFVVTVDSDAEIVAWKLKLKITDLSASMP